MHETICKQGLSKPADNASSASIILAANQNRQVIDSEITNLEACEIFWLLSQIKKYGFAAVEETLVYHLLENKAHDYTL